jgi:hypothetical protein
MLSSMASQFNCAQVFNLINKQELVVYNELTLPGSLTTVPPASW